MQRNIDSNEESSVCVCVCVCYVLPETETGNDFVNRPVKISVVEVNMNLQCIVVQFYYVRQLC